MGRHRFGQSRSKVFIKTVFAFFFYLSTILGEVYVISLTSRFSVSERRKQIQNERPQIIVKRLELIHFNC